MPTDLITPALATTTTEPSAPSPTVPGEAPDAATTVITPAVAEEEGMNLTVVFDNNAYDPRLRTSWGFAAWLEVGGQTVLFDTGGDGGLLLGNMEALGLDPKQVEVVVLSHIHGDHVGGLGSLLTVNPQVTVYLPEAFPAQTKRGVRAAGAAVVEVSDPLEILPGVWSTGQMGSGLVEQAMAVRTGRGLVVVTGCAHPGVDRMAARAAKVGQEEIALVVGGFHLGGASRKRVQEIIDQFQRLGVQEVAPCHCTGDQARAVFAEAYGEAYHACGAGWQWEE
jgi:7,8-dihydropterin-6-yl-methyl-4-(beta-D-ribofuranosyl)aminobenzene 5'-phosphate synthase